MASNHAFFAHRLGYRDVDCEKGCGCGSPGRECVAKDTDVLSETERRWCTDSERKHTWRRRCDVVSFPRIRSTTPPPNQFCEPQASTSHTLSSSPLLSVPHRRTQQKAGRASSTPCSPPQGAACSLPVSCGEPQSGRLHGGTSYTQEEAKLAIVRPVAQHSFGTRGDRKTTHTRQQAVPWTEDQISASSSFPNTFALDQALPLQGEGSVPNTLSNSAKSFSIRQNRPVQAVIPSSNGSRLNRFDPSRRTSVFSFFSQHNQSVAASLIRLEKTILKYEGAIFEILNAHASPGLSRGISSKDTPGSLLTAVQTTHDREAQITTKMSNPFRSSSGKTTPKESRDTPPRAIFSNYPAAHSAITNVLSAKGEKIPSPTPGLPATDNPYANLPPTIDLPETPAKHTGGPASEGLKARIASIESWGVDIPERPETPLLPPTPVLTQLERRGASGQDISQLFHQPFPPECQPIGKKSYELKVLKRDTRNDPSHVDDHDCSSETRTSVSTFGLESPSPCSAHRAAERRPSDRRCLGPDVHQSSTLDSIIGRYNDDSEFLRIREGSQRSIEITNSHEVSSLSADDDDDDDDGEVHIQDSTAGHTPPLASLMLARNAPERSTSGHPPRDPPPDVPARQVFRDVPDAGDSEPTNYGHTRELLNMTSELEEVDLLQAADPAEYNRRRGLVFNPRAGMSATDRLMLVKQGYIPVYRDISDQEREMLERSASGGSPHVGNEHDIGFGDRNEGSVGGLLRPVAYMPNDENHRLDSVGPRQPLHWAVREQENDEEEEPVRLRRQPHLIPGPDMTRFGRFLDHGGPQSSSSQGLSTNSSFRQGRMASEKFQHDETLASLTGEVLHDSPRNLESLIKDVGGMFEGVEEEDDGAVFENDVVAVKDEEDGDDADWETLHESGLKARIPQKSNTNREETATSLANMSSYGSLTGSVPATPWGPLTGRARVLTHPPKAALPHQSRVRTDSDTGLSLILPEYEASDRRYEYEGVEMTRKVRPHVLDRPFPAFTTTIQDSATPQQQFHATYRHPEPMSQEHQHPFSLTPPDMALTHDSRANSLTNPGTASDQMQYLGPAKDVEDVEEGATQRGLVMSKKRNTPQFSASAAGEGLKPNMRDTRELSRPSNLSADGSYSESSRSGPALSTSSIIHDSQYLPQPTGTFSKSTILGPKGNITGSFDGTGMRAVGSSEADYSTDSAMMKSHKYERLDDERTLDRAQPFRTNTPAEQSTPKTSKKVTFAETSQTQMVVPALVLTKDGLSISAPKEFKIPTTVPKRNSFAISILNMAKRLDENQTMTTTPFLFDYDNEPRELHLQNIRGLIDMTADDWNRLQSECMTFPLRDDHLNDVLELDGISTGQKRCHRDKIQPDGRYSESAKCDNCNRWERSHTAVLLRQPFNRVRAATQQEIGKRIVFWCTMLPFIGWGFLFVIAYRMEASNDLIAGFTKGVIREFGDAEIEAADFYFKCIIGSLFLLFLALLIFTIVIVVQS